MKHLLLYKNRGAVPSATELDALGLPKGVIIAVSEESKIIDYSAAIRFESAVIGQAMAKAFGSGGRLTYEQASAVTNEQFREANHRLPGSSVLLFQTFGQGNFNEFQYFTGITEILAIESREGSGESYWTGGFFKAVIGEITLPPSLVKVSGKAFSGSTVRKINVTNPAGFPEMTGSSAFEECTSLSGTIDLSGANQVPARSFAGIHGGSGTRFTLRAGVETEPEAFKDTEWADFEGPESGPVGRLGNTENSAFENSGITGVSSIEGTRVGDNAFKGSKISGNLTVSVDHVGSGAFSGTGQLESLQFPKNTQFGTRALANGAREAGGWYADNLREIRFGANQGASGLNNSLIQGRLKARVEVDPANTELRKEGNGVYDRANSTLIMVDPITTDLQVAPGTTRIGRTAALGALRLKTVTIPASVQSLDQGALLIGVDSFEVVSGGKVTTAIPEGYQWPSMTFGISVMAESPEVKAALVHPGNTDPGSPDFTLTPGDGWTRKIATFEAPGREVGIKVFSGKLKISCATLSLGRTEARRFPVPVEPGAIVAAARSARLFGSSHVEVPVIRGEVGGGPGRPVETDSGADLWAHIRYSADAGRSFTQANPGQVATDLRRRLQSGETGINLVPSLTEFGSRPFTWVLQGNPSRTSLRPQDLPAGATGGIEFSGSARLAYYFNPSLERLDPGRPYTLSFWMSGRGASGPMVRAGFFQGPPDSQAYTTTLTGDWSKHTVTLVANGPGSSSALTFMIQGYGGPVWIADIKLETGTTATPWSESPKSAGSGTDRSSRYIGVALSGSKVAPGSPEYYGWFRNDYPAGPGAPDFPLSFPYSILERDLRWNPVGAEVQRFPGVDPAYRVLQDTGETLSIGLLPSSGGSRKIEVFTKEGYLTETIQRTPIQVKFEGLPPSGDPMTTLVDNGNPQNVEILVRPEHLAVFRSQWPGLADRIKSF